MHLTTFRCWGYTDSQPTEKGLHSSPVAPYRGESVSMMPHVNKAHTDHSNDMNDVQQKAKKNAPSFAGAYSKLKSVDGILV